MTDYLIMDFSAPGEGNINFYSAYYASQRNGASIHSPRSCMPGDGWRITSLEQRQFAELPFQGEPLQLNRAVIEKGDMKQLVYYWFPQRGRQVTNEYLVKWHLLIDAITLHRTDGALVRLVTALDSGQDLSVADKRLHDFLSSLVKELPAYLPGRNAVVASTAQIR